MSHVTINNRIILSGSLITNDRQEILLLYRTDHQHYETPGGKVELKECENPNNPTRMDLRLAAERELKEELGKEIKFQLLKYFGAVKFTIPDGRLAVAHKFLTKIRSGTPKINEPKIFSKLNYLPIANLEHYPLSPDLKLFLSKLKELPKMNDKVFNNH